MASQTFTASQVCQTVTREDGDVDYTFPGSDDDLGMEDMDNTDELERQTESEGDADAEIESVDGNSPGVENSTSPSSPREMNSDNCSGGRGRRGRGRGLVEVAVAVVGDKVRKDIMKQLVDLQKRDGQRVAVCKFSLSQ